MAPRSGSEQGRVDVAGVVAGGDVDDRGAGVVRAVVPVLGHAAADAVDEHRPIAAGRQSGDAVRAVGGGGRAGGDAGRTEGQHRGGGDGSAGGLVGEGAGEAAPERHHRPVGVRGGGVGDRTADLRTVERPVEEYAESPAWAAATLAPPVLPGREPAAPAERQELARVNAELLDELLNNAGEVSIFRARVEQQMTSIEFNLAELDRTVTRLREQLRKLELET